MSVLIKGMKMPKGCGLCRFDDYGYCTMAKQYSGGSATHGRASFCPLVEIPSKHGRLVDFDKIEWYEVTGTATVGDRDFGETKFALINIDHFRNLPTVIEAEGE